MAMTKAERHAMLKRDVAMMKAQNARSLTDTPKLSGAGRKAIEERNQAWLEQYGARDSHEANPTTIPNHHAQRLADALESENRYMNMNQAKQDAVADTKDYTDTADVILNVLHQGDTKALSSYELFEVIADDAWKAMNKEDYNETEEETQARLTRIWELATAGLKVQG